MTKRKTNEEFLKEVQNITYNIEFMTEYVNAKTKIKCKCKICNNIWDTLPHNILKGHGCPKCGFLKVGLCLKRTQLEYIKAVEEVNPNIEIIGTYIGNNIKIRHKCKICGYGNNGEWSIVPASILDGRKCPVCSGEIIGPSPLYKNSIFSSNEKEYFSKYMTDEQMKMYKPNSVAKIEVSCPVCKRKKEIIIRNLGKQGLGCICGDGFSYANKFMYNLLEQLEIVYIKEYSPEWGENKKYDIYIPSINCIIENHGIQHYKDCSWFTHHDLKQEKENDTKKRTLAHKNGIKHYIEIDFRYSQLEYCKKSIENSQLQTLLKLSNKNVDWKKCDAFASYSNIIKTVAELWENGLSFFEIKQKTALSSSGVHTYLTKAAKFGWCDYTPKEARKRKYCDGHYQHPFAKKIIKLQDGTIYNSIKQASESNNLNAFRIRKECAMGKTFMFYNDWIDLQKK